MFKKISCMLFALLFVGMTVFASGFTSNASYIMHGSSNNSHYLPYPEPNTTENQGYLVLVDKYGSVITYFWQLHVKSSPADTLSAEITKETQSGHDGHMRFGVWGFSDSDTEVSYDIYKYDSNGLMTLVGHTLNQATCLNPGTDIIGAKVGGNIYFPSLNTYSYKFNVYFDESGSSALLYDIISKLSSSNNYDSNMADTLTRLLNQCTNANEQLTKVTSYLSSIKSLLTDIEADIDILLEKYDKLIEEQEESNTWLEKIFDLLNKSKEEEKQEATTQGNSSTADGMDAIEDKGGDFASSLGGLTGSMSYTGTECAWEFPEVKLPAIPGVMDEIVLIQKQPIDFSMWVNAIPSSILVVVQSLCTIGLIVYCFKELYSTIAYVLTLRKDDNA